MDNPMSTTNIENNEQIETPCTPPPPIDAKINISISDNQLEAYLFIEPSSNGGVDPTFEAMEAMLFDYGVSYNIDMDKLKEIEIEPIYNCDILVASGVAPVNGVDGTATFQIDTEKKSLKPKEDNKGKVDYHLLGIVENVKQGQVLCVITLPTKGSPGMSVKGKELPQKKGKPVQSLLGKNTELNSEGTAIISKINGQAEFDGRRLHVNDVLYIKENVDYSVGNIKVPNNLDISGMVMPGFVIEVGGNIDVRGIVQKSTVKAGGNINLQSGIISSTLYCDGDLNCKFIENCDIFVKGDINSRNIINSNIKCGKTIKINGTSAKIIGGTYVAGENIEAQTIGSAANVKTRLELSTDQTVITRQQQLLDQVAQWENQNEKLIPLITLLNQLEAANRLTPDKKQALEKASYTYNTNVQSLEDAKSELEDIAQYLEEKGHRRIICSGTIYPGTHVVIGKANLSITNTLECVSLYYDEGNIGIGSAR